MAIETICNGCAKKLRVADENAGKKARCPDCGTIYTVPAATSPARSLFDDLAAEKPVEELGRLAPLAPAAAERWLMRLEDGREYGPVDRATLDQWYAERRIGPTTQLKREHEYAWQPASSVYPALAAASVATPPAANPFAESSSYSGYTSTVGYGSPGRTYAQPHRGALIIILAVLSWFIGCFVFGAVAWALASADLAEMRAGRMDPSGEGLTRAGQIIGAIHTVLSLCVIGMFILFFFFAIIAGA